MESGDHDGAVFRSLDPYLKDSASDWKRKRNCVNPMVGDGREVCVNPIRGGRGR